MEEMGGDEVFAGIVGLVLAVIGAFYWYGPLLRRTLLGVSSNPRFFLAAVPPACLAALSPVLFILSAREVREDGRYILLFLVIGAAWTLMAGRVVPLFGFSLVEDAIERGNDGAAAASAGATAGMSACFILANIGEGPTIWTTIGPAVLATGGLLGLWFIVELATAISEAIAVDRDLASGLRLAGFLSGAGLILGRAVEGNWESPAATLTDFCRDGWPAAVLAAALIAMQHLSHPTPRQPVLRPVPSGAVPGAVFLALGGGWAILH